MLQPLAWSGLSQRCIALFKKKKKVWVFSIVFVLKGKYCITKKKKGEGLFWVREDIRFSRWKWFKTTSSTTRMYFFHLLVSFSPPVGSKVKDSFCLSKRERYRESARCLLMKIEPISTLGLPFILMFYVKRNKGGQVNNTRRGQHFGGLQIWNLNDFFSQKYAL